MTQGDQSPMIWALNIRKENIGDKIRDTSAYNRGKPNR